MSDGEKEYNSLAPSCFAAITKLMLEKQDLVDENKKLIAILDKWQHWTPDHNIEQWLVITQKQLADLRAQNIPKALEKHYLRDENARLYRELVEAREIIKRITP